MKNKIIAILIGVIFVGVSVFLYFNNKRLNEVCTTAVEATYIRDNIRYEEDSYLYCPVFEYYAGEIKYTVEFSTCTGNSRYIEGQKVNVLYNPDKPEEYILADQKPSNIISFVFGGLGILVVVAGLFFKPKENE